MAIFEPGVPTTPPGPGSIPIINPATGNYAGWTTPTSPGLTPTFYQNPSGGGINLFKDTSGNLFTDSQGKNPFSAERQVSGAATGYQINNTFNPELQPRLGANGVVTDAATALTQQATDRTKALMGQSGLPLSTYGTAPSLGTPAGSSFNTNRSLISTTPQAGYIKAYDTNDNYKQVYVPAGKYVPGVSLYPKPSDTMTSESLGSTSNVSVPGVSGTSGTAATSLVVGANASIAEIIKSLTPPKTEAEVKQQTLLDQMASLVGQEAKKASDQLTAEQSAGLPELRKQFADINAQILTKTAEYNVLQTENQNKPITMNSIIGNERAILNAKAADIGLLTARAQALQGQIGTAQDTVNRAIDLKYSTIESQLQVYQAQLNALQPTLNKEEKIAAQAQQLIIDAEKQRIADTKNKEKEQNGVIIDLIAKYPDASITFNDTLATAQAKLKNSRIYQQQTRLASGTSGGTGITPSGVGGALTDWDIYAEAVSNKLGSVAAKNSFNKQYAQAKTDEQKLKVLAANVVLPTEVKNGIIQNAQVTRSIDDVIGLLNKGVQTGLLQAGQSYIANKLGSGGDKQVEQIKSKLITALQPYRNKVTGAAWGDQEEAEYQALIGSTKFSPDDLRNKLNTFKNSLQNQSQAAIMAGIDPLGAINQTSILQNQPSLNTQTKVTDTPQTSSGGIWSSIVNFFTGKSSKTTGSYDDYLKAIK